MPIPAILDCDTGHDDAMAILLAAGTLDLRGVTTVHGNASVENTTINTCKILELAGLAHTPVAVGASQPLERRISHAPGVHGITGMDGPDLPPPTMQPVGEHAVEFIARMAGRGGGPAPRGDRAAHQHRRHATGPPGAARLTHRGHQPHGRLHRARECDRGGGVQHLGGSGCGRRGVPQRHSHQDGGAERHAPGSGHGRAPAAHPRARHAHRARGRGASRFLQRTVAAALRVAGRVHARSAGGLGPGRPAGAALRAHAGRHRALGKAHLRDDGVRPSPPVDGVRGMVRQRAPLGSPNAEVAVAVDPERFWERFISVLASYP